MNTNDFDFELPEELIAQTPLEQRDASKLLVIDPVTKEMTDTHFDHIIDQLNPGDALVMNNTRVLPARLYGTILRKIFSAFPEFPKALQDCLPREAPCTLPPP